MDWFEFEIEGAAGMHVRVEANGGALKFILDNEGSKVADLRGFFFDVKDAGVLSSLHVTGSNITGQASGNEAVVNLGNGVTMAGSGAEPFDIGLAFGTAGIGKDDIDHAEFTLSSTGRALTLDDVLGMDFGVRFTSVGVDGGARNESLKLFDVGEGTVHHEGVILIPGGDLPPIDWGPVA